MEPDPVVEEIHRIRAALLASFNGDLHAYVEDARRRQAASGRPTVTFKRETIPPDVDSSESTPDVGGEVR